MATKLEFIEVLKEELKKITEKNEKQNYFMFRWGGTGTDIKVYYDDVDDLLDQLKKLSSHVKEIKDSISSFSWAMSKE
uniref:Uncharacterized protein n=1 Tax=viral metagenome TaxID=1070528 RepID=A0A6H1ZPX8_9ZZZZ